MTRGRYERACKKVRWRDLAQGHAAIRRIRGKAKEGERVPVRPYECGRCHGVHLTSLEIDDLEYNRGRASPGDLERQKQEARLTLEDLQRGANRERGLT